MTFHIFTNKVIAINGGGDSAGDYAEQLAPIAKKIYLVHRRNKFRFPDSMLDRLKQMDNVEIITPAYIEKVKHNDGYIAELTLSNDRVLQVENLLCFFGLSNSVDYMSSWGFDMENGKILVDDSYSSSLPGVYAVSISHTVKAKLKRSLYCMLLRSLYRRLFIVSILEHEHKDTLQYEFFII